MRKLLLALILSGGVIIYFYTTHLARWGIGELHPGGDRGASHCKQRPSLPGRRVFWQPGRHRSAARSLRGY